ncbi:MAG: PHP domain-containing protein [Firmicutes bacterium]|nr:PHP domain-containing protein [Bacillota bacterium]
MAFFGDYHTHTKYSHGKGSVEDNVRAAVAKGLKEVGITDHGFKHMTYNVRRIDWPVIEKDVKAVRAKYPQINIRLGLETNFCSLQGHIDVLPSEIPAMDLVICGYHVMAKPERSRDFFRCWLPNVMQAAFIHKSSRRMYARNTDMYLKALEKYEIDILSHPNHPIKIDVVEVAKAAKHFGTYYELNGKRIGITDKQLGEVAATGVEFICDSDAHSPERVGDFELGATAARRVGIPYNQIANWERLPSFRSRKPKESRDAYEFIK